MNKTEKVVCMLNLEVIDLKENEQIIMTFDDVIVQAEDNQFILAMCITNQRILLYQDVNRQLPRFWPTTIGTHKPKYELVYDLDKNNIKSFECKKGINYLKVDNEHILEIYCENLEKYLFNNYRA